VIEKIISVLAPDNNTAHLCGFVGKLAKNKDAKLCESWLQGCLVGTIAAIHDAASRMR
jgi:hypothetical protein